MSMTRLMAGVALVGLMAQPALAQNQDQPQPQAPVAAGAVQPRAQQDMDFATKAAGAGRAEVRLGELAVERAASADVKQFGQRMIDDHSQAGEQLAAIAAQRGIDLPQDLPDEAQQAVDELQQASAPEFDQAFMDTMVDGHQKAVGLYEEQARSGQDPELRSFAEATLPTVQEHLKLAEQTLEQLTVMAGEGDAGMPADQMAAGEPAATPGQQPVATEPQPDQAAVTQPIPDQTAAGGEAMPTHEPAMTEATPDQLAAGTEAMPEQEPVVTDATPDQPAVGMAATPEPEPAAPAAMGAAVLAENVIGTDVVNRNGDEVGTIDDLVIDRNQVGYAVVSVGGFLGIGDKAVAIPLDQMELGEDQSYLLSAQTVDQLKEMPEYDESQFQPRG